ncbi:hypothetical protein [Viridibacillus arvi]|uniref:hypothetical protein n=1 Tax=Viridibacillus arvi TaxID=263475 RepID=UPI0034CDA92F
MAIQLNQLTVNTDVKKVREYISTPQGSIEVYEPTLEMANEILAIQEESGFDFASGIVKFDEITLLTKVFPLLTNIETGDLPEDELQKIIDNPSIHLLIAQNIVAQIISEINKLYAERLKAELASAETVLAQSDLISTIPSIINEHAKRNPEVAESLRQIDSVQSEVEQLMEQGEKPTETDQVEVQDDKEA